MKQYCELFVAAEMDVVINFLTQKGYEGLEFRKRLRHGGLAIEIQPMTEHIESDFDDWIEVKDYLCEIDIESLSSFNSVLIPYSLCLAEMLSYYLKIKVAVFFRELEEFICEFDDGKVSKGNIKDSLPSWSWIPQS